MVKHFYEVFNHGAHFNVYRSFRLRIEYLLKQLTKYVIVARIYSNIAE